MKTIYSLLFLLALATTSMAQTLHVKVGQVTYLFPAFQTGDMTYADGSTLTIMGKTFALSDIDAATIDNAEAPENTVSVTYDGDVADILISGDVAKYLSPKVSGAHVSIEQSSDLDREITYTLSGESTDGEFYMAGSYKSTIEFNGLSLTNVTPVFSGAAVHIQNGKRIKVKVVTGTVNTLTDAASGTQKGCLYIKGHAEIAQKGTLNVVGKANHGIKTGEYLTLKNAIVNVTAALSDGVNCGQFFLIDSGSLSISGTGDDGIQCDVDGDTPTAETEDHENEDSGNVYLCGGNVSITVAANAAKGIKSEGCINVSGGDITIATTGGGAWDSDAKKTKAAACLAADGDVVVSGGTLTLSSSGAGGKGVNTDGSFAATGATMTVRTSGNAVVASVTGSLTTVSSSQQLDRYASNYKSSPKGIKADGVVSISGDAIIGVTTTGAGGEGIESKQAINISGGQVAVEAADDAINASYTSANGSKTGTGDLTISGGLVYARSTGNDGIDSNGNCYVKGGLVYAVGKSNPEVAIDANSEEQKKLYVTGGTLVALGGLERGASLTQTCYSASSWSKNTWYALTYGGETIAFKTPSSGGSTLVVSAASAPTLKSGVTVGSGTSVFGGMAYTDATATGGSSVSLSTYTGGGGGGPGGGGWRW